ncbi:MAG: hypothetical protein VX915_01345 [Pseudomonadota bacterium]|nr:hypothetical protein [Pseudomonadota bacterium]
MTRVTLIVAGLFILIALTNISQTSMTQWQPRPNISCDNGEPVHRFAFVNANRVNIRDLPTVFSNVLDQKNKNDPITVVCEFGVWSRISAEAIGPDTWISSGLITLDQNQPVSIRMKATLLIFLSFGLTGLAICLWYPRAIERFVNLLLQTQELPPHARPLISVRPQYHPARDQK